MPIESDKAFGTEIPGRKTLGDFIGSIDMDFIVIRMCNACICPGIPFHQSLKTLTVAAGSRFRHRGQVFLVSR